MINQQYPYMEDVSGTNGGMQDTRSQDALHQALLLRTSQANPQVQANQQNNNMLAQLLKQGNKNKHGAFREHYVCKINHFFHEKIWASLELIMHSFIFGGLFVFLKLF